MRGGAGKQQEYGATSFYDRLHDGSRIPRKKRLCQNTGAGAGRLASRKRYRGTRRIQEDSTYLEHNALGGRRIVLYILSYRAELFIQSRTVHSACVTEGGSDVRVGVPAPVYIRCRLLARSMMFQRLL